jgi:hypothetical protein
MPTVPRRMANSDWQSQMPVHHCRVDAFLPSLTARRKDFLFQRPQFFVWFPAEIGKSLIGRVLKCLTDAIPWSCQGERQYVEPVSWDFEPSLGPHYTDIEN